MKYILWKWFGVKDSKVQGLISQAELVSFDIFDTLVKRGVAAPEHVHRMVAEKFFKRTGIKLQGYHESRMAAEREAKQHCRKEEISLDDIFKCLEGVSENQKKILKQIEEKTEMEICCPDLRIKRLYEQALKEKKHIVVASDMYLKEEVIREILKKCGYEDFERLYLSSSYNLCKSTGRIYEVIKRDYPEFCGKILHIGDNFKSDYLKPKKRGVRGCLINGQQRNLVYWKRNRKDDFDYEKIYCFLNNHIGDRGSDAAVIGYEILGPMLLGYCKWLKGEIERNGIDKIFFLSREGRLLQDAFQLLYPENNIEQHYLYVSRQSLVIPLIADAVDFDEMIDMIKGFLHIPLLSTVGIVCSLERSGFCRALSEIGIGEDTKVYEVPQEKKEAVFSIIHKLGNKHFKQQKEFIKKYLQESGFEGNVAIADIGWVGTIQRALSRYIADTDTDIYGYYLGVRDLEKNAGYGNLHRNGYLFETGKNEDFDLMVRFTMEAFELLFLHQAGSVQEYGMESGIITPVLSDGEYGGKEGEFIESVQRAALEFLQTVGQNTVFRDGINVRPEYVMGAYAGFAVYPRLATIRHFEKFSFLDVKVKKLLPDHGIFYYFFHIKELKRDFSNSFCKIFFLKKLLKLNLPYYELLRFMAVKMNVRSDYRKRFYGEKK